MTDYQCETIVDAQTGITVSIHTVSVPIPESILRLARALDEKRLERDRALASEWLDALWDRCFHGS